MAIEDTFENEGASIINLSFINGTSTYCCGTPIIDGDDIVCPFGKDSFEIDDGEILPGYNALANVTTLSASTNSSSNSTTSCPTINTTTSPSSGSHDVALGAGLGVPLGVIALGSLIWGFMERRRANRLSKAVSNSTPATEFVGHSVNPQVTANTESSGPSELDTSRRMPELEARG